MIEDKDLEQLEHQFGANFVAALKTAIGVGDNLATFRPLQVGEAKDRFSRVLEDVRAGQCRVVQKRSEEPVLMISLGQLGRFVAEARPRRRFADTIAPDPALPTDAPALIVSRRGVGRDKVTLKEPMTEQRKASSG